MKVRRCSKYIEAEACSAIAALKGCSILTGVENGTIAVVYTCQFVDRIVQGAKLDGQLCTRCNSGVFRDGIALCIGDGIAGLLGGNHLIGSDTILFDLDDMAALGQALDRNLTGFRIRFYIISAEAVIGQAIGAHDCAGYADRATAFRGEGEFRACGSHKVNGVMLRVGIHIGNDCAAVRTNTDHKYTGVFRPDCRQLGSLA